MNFTLSAEAGSFFTKHGWVELEIAHPAFAIENKRDAWRHNSALKTFLVKKIGSLALALARKKTLHLACDQGFLAGEQPKRSGSIKEQVSIQGLAIGVAIAFDFKKLERKQELGIVPTPSEKGRVLFFRPDLILDWSHLGNDVYIALYALQTAVYAHNPNDPHTNALKAMGYSFGDRLKNEFHPLIL